MSFAIGTSNSIKPVLNGNGRSGESGTRDAGRLGPRPHLAASASLHAGSSRGIVARMAEHAVPRRSMLMAVALARFVGLCQDEHARNEMNWLIDLISGVRSVRAEMNVPPSARLTLVLKDAGRETSARLTRHRDIALTLARLSSARVSAEIPQGSAQFVIGEAVAALPLAMSSILPRSARARKGIEKGARRNRALRCETRQSGFVAKAPEEVIEEQKEKRAEARLSLRACARL